MDELERLRDVARAAAALIQADDESTASIRPLRDQEEPPVDQLKEVHRLGGIYFARRAELVAALARLAELDPPAD